MKNHIIFKFIAILLCAASLMGAVGGVLGVVLLSSGGLYDVTVEEMVSAQVSQHSAELADWLIKNYASTELGGAPEALVQSHYGNHWFTNQYDPAHYGYSILDAEGNELLSYNPELREREDLYARESFPASGKYMYVVSLESQTEKDSRHQQQREEVLGDDVVLAESVGTVPAEGAIVEQVIFADVNGEPVLDLWDNGSSVIVNDRRGNGWHLGQAETLGFLYYSPSGQLMFQSAFNYLDYVGSLETEDIYEAYFTFRDGQVRLHKNEPVGQLYVNGSGHLVFLSTLLERAPEETVPETTGETVPETTAETVPPAQAPGETEVPEETRVEETRVEETVASSASDVPEMTSATEPAPVETLPSETTVTETVPEETLPAETEPLVIDGKSIDEYEILSDSYFDGETGEPMDVKFVYVPLPELTVEVYMAEEALLYANGYRMLEVVRTYRNYLLPATAVCLLVFAIFAVYLCTAAGRNPKSDEILCGGLNRIPLDLYLAAGGFGAACIIAVGGEIGLQLLEQDFWTGCALLLGLTFFCCLLLVGFCYAVAAQFKTPNGFWWRNTLVGHFFRLFFRFSEWAADWGTQKLLPFLGRLLRSLWDFTMRAFVWLYKATEKAMLWLGNFLGKVFRWLGRLLHRFLKLLPVTWQWLLAGLAIIFCVMLIPEANDFMTVILLLIPITVILYIAHCYGTLAEATKRMSKGDLETKVDDSLMVGCFKDSAADLSALADVAVVAAQKQLKSERMKSELVTNVSHDIKTPLTSIINYVDLLKKPHTEEEGAQYLEVLDRQSQRLKKLLEDLMDMSKANTGNMTVEITTVDAVEAINQALGEFSDKLSRAGLTPVFRYTEESIPMQADGRLVWRVLSNLLGNAVKYAMPGTRLYVDLAALEGNVVISLKNISREELNIDAEELMARFVRGDASRNTEGSGLGLNIARSLMDLQKGELQLLVDGDLFKVTLIFPGNP